ncbi:MAG: hypothetical protein AAGK93_09175, partial [Pseudomonadota bacterium]
MTKPNQIALKHDPFDPEEAERIADWLDIVRTQLDGWEALSSETHSELGEALSLAEAALRRASVEATMSQALLT